MVSLLCIWHVSHLNFLKEINIELDFHISTSYDLFGMAITKEIYKWTRYKKDHFLKKESYHIFLNNLNTF